MVKIILFSIALFLNLTSTYAQDGWTKQLSGTTNTINNLYFTDINTGYAAGNSGTLLKTSNAGSSWSALPSGTTSDIQKVYFTSASNGYFLCKNGQVFQSTSSGAAWSGQSINNLSLNGISFFGSKGIIVGDEGFVATTTNGNTWTVQNDLGVFALNDVEFINDSLAVAVGASGVIYRTADAGITWSSINSNTTFSLSAIEKQDNGNTIIVGAGGTILHFNPLSKVLENKSAGLTNTWLKDVNCSLFDRCYIAGYSSSLLILNTTWQLKNIDAEENYNTVFFSSYDIGFMAGLNGVIYKSETAGFGINTINVEYNSISIFPNPIQNSFVFSIPENKNGSLSIFDAKGALQKNVLIDSPNSIIDISNFSSGLYYYTFQSSSQLFTGKFIKL